MPEALIQWLSTCRISGIVYGADLVRAFDQEDAIVRAERCITWAMREKLIQRQGPVVASPVFYAFEPTQRLVSESWERLERLWANR